MNLGCLDQYQSDPGGAALCSSGNEQAIYAYQDAIAVAKCVEDEGDDEWAVAGCLGDQVLDGDQAYYLRCMTENQGDWQFAAVCAVAKDLNPEQQIALACAISTGGQPQAFAACTAGRLTARELEKCWENGIGTNQGCFGPNNELVKAAKFARNVRDYRR